MKASERLFFCVVQCLSSIHEKANCIVIFWTERSHSLGSCHFRGVWATCLLHKGGGVPLSALPKDTTSELAGLFSTTSHKCRAPSREAVNTIFKVFWYDSAREMNPRPTDCGANALTQWFPNFFVCQHSMSVKQISRYTSYLNLFQLMSSGIADNSENGADLSLGKDHHLSGKRSSDIE